jgi:glyoxylase-like metal-dependent hydrolase (beta-lactamase superfamily II)
VGSIDLGGRVVDVIPIPGHQTASIALYDRKTGNLLTGDSLYPGRLYTTEADLPVYAESTQRLADWVTVHPVAHVLGTHIEQSSHAYVDYPVGTKYQPEEHVLELSRAHVLELNDAMQAVKTHPVTVALPDFTISVRAPNPPAKKSN